MNIVFFESPAEFRNWLRQNHTTATELWIGFWRKDSARKGLTYLEAVDEALCHGWIDGVRRKLDATSYTNRFTPRRKKSHWSSVNLRRVEELTRAGRMAPAGAAAHNAREISRMSGASYEQKSVQLSSKLETQFRRNKKAYAFFMEQPPYYRRLALWWIVSAKKEETQLRRMTALIANSAQGRRVPRFTSAPKLQSLKSHAPTSC